jgi:hypothetical protein
MTAFPCLLTAPAAAIPFKEQKRILHLIHLKPAGFLHDWLWKSAGDFVSHVLTAAKSVKGEMRVA